MPKPRHIIEAEITRRHYARRAWGWFIVALWASLFLESFYDMHGHFDIDGTPYFHAWYGFISCAGIIFISKFLGLFLKRPQHYYDGGES